MGTEEGYVGTFVDGQFNLYTNFGARVDAVVLDRANRVWIASFDNLARIEPDTATVQRKALVVWSEMEMDRRGDVWTVLASRGTARLENDQFESVGGTDRFKHSIIRYPSKDEILRMREMLNNILVDNTGQPMDKINQDTDRDYIMTAVQSREYGLIDQVITERGSEA